MMIIPALHTEFQLIDLSGLPDRCENYRTLLFFRSKILNFRIQNLYEYFLHENFYTRSNYSNRAVIHINHTKIFLHKNFILKIFPRNYGNIFCIQKVDRVIVTQVGICVVSPWPLSGFLSNHKKALLR